MFSTIRSTFFYFRIVSCWSNSRKPSLGSNTSSTCNITSVLVWAHFRSSLLSERRRQLEQIEVLADSVEKCLEASENAESLKLPETWETCNKNIFKESFSLEKGLKNVASTRDLLLNVVEKYWSKMCHNQTNPSWFVPRTDVQNQISLRQCASFPQN